MSRLWKRIQEAGTAGREREQERCARDEAQGRDESVAAWHSYIVCGIWHPMCVRDVALIFELRVPRALGAQTTPVAPRAYARRALYRHRQDNSPADPKAEYEDCMAIIRISNKVTFT